MTVNTPALTTATACSRALTGVGATIAAGSQRWNGISAALPVPKAYSASSTRVPVSATLPARMPPGRNSSVPATSQVQTTASSSMPIDVVSSTPR